VPPRGSDSILTGEPSEIDPYVDWLARRIASFPAEPVRLAEQVIGSADKPLADGFRDESYLFQQLIRTKSGRRNMLRFFEIVARPAMAR